MNTTTTNFRMRIRQTFCFRDGRTVLVGPVEGQEIPLRSCACELLVNGQVRQIIMVEGEMMPEPRHELGYRSVASRDKLSISPQEVETQECFLQAAKPKN